MLEQSQTKSSFFLLR